MCVLVILCVCVCYTALDQELNDCTDQNNVADTVVGSLPGGIVSNAKVLSDTADYLRNISTLMQFFEKKMKIKLETEESLLTENAKRKVNFYYNAMLTLKTLAEDASFSPFLCNEERDKARFIPQRLRQKLEEYGFDVSQVDTQ